jgi:hypothetical protein
MPPGDPVEIGIRGPDFALIVLEHEQPYRPVETGIRIGGDELSPERRIAEDQQHRRLQLDAGIGRELRLIDLSEELDAFAGNVRFQAFDGFSEGIAALDPNDPVIRCAGNDG